MKSSFEAYLDIETTGLSPRYHDVTVVGIHLEDGCEGKLIQLVGQQISAANILQALGGVNTIYTYNGSRFDLPFLYVRHNVNLAKEFKHCDLMYHCWKNSLYGGFKAVERQLGIQRRLIEEGKKLYQQYIQTNDWGRLLLFVDQRLPQKPDGWPDADMEQSDVVHDLLAFLAEEMTKLYKGKQAEIKGFITWLDNYLSINVDSMKNKTKVKDYWKVEVAWEGFLYALNQIRKAIESASGIDVTRREPQETLRAEFNGSVAKLKPLLRRIEQTDKLIDKIVYRLYGLTEEELQIVQGKAMPDVTK